MKYCFVWNCVKWAGLPVKTFSNKRWRKVPEIWHRRNIWCKIAHSETNKRMVSNLDNLTLDLIYKNFFFALAYCIYTQNKQATTMHFKKILCKSFQIQLQVFGVFFSVDFWNFKDGISKVSIFIFNRFWLYKEILPTFN